MDRTLFVSINYLNYLEYALYYIIISNLVLFDDPKLLLNSDGPIRVVQVLCKLDIPLQNVPEYALNQAMYKKVCTCNFLYTSTRSFIYLNRFIGRSSVQSQ